MRALNVVGFAIATGSFVLFATAHPGCSPAASGPTLGNGSGGHVVASEGGKSGGQGGTSDSGGSGGGGSGITFVLPDANIGGAGGDSTTVVETWPPSGYTNVTATTFGAYALGPLVSTLAAQTGGAGGSSSPGSCAFLRGVVRDFKMGNLAGGHPDFEKPTPMDDPGIVKSTLGDDGKPQYADPNGTGKTLTTSGQSNFDQWYRDVDGVNYSYVVALKFDKNGSVFTFAAALSNASTTGPGQGPGRRVDAGTTAPGSSYFPVDGAGWNDTARADDGKQHNFAFTTEIHTTFVYKGGETFTFQGDDDVFVFINKHLAIDLGGIHVQETKTVDLDTQASALEISTGNTYDLAVFNAERHTTQSNFRIDTTLVFKDCGSIIY
jgi:fibro-slime domain-containing protein